jgi:hypothetical protein
LRRINAVEVDESVEGLYAAEALQWVVSMADELCNFAVYYIVELGKPLLWKVYLDVSGAK